MERGISAQITPIDEKSQSIYRLVERLSAQQTISFGLRSLNQWWTEENLALNQPFPHGTQAWPEAAVFRKAQALPLNAVGVVKNDQS